MSRRALARVRSLRAGVCLPVAVALVSRRALARIRSLQGSVCLSVAVALLAGLLAACSAGSAPHSASPSAPAHPSGPPLGLAGPPPTTMTGYYAQKLRWRPCDHGFQCARLLVPFGYQRPGRPASRCR